MKKRVKKRFPESTVSFVPGDCNEQIDRICGEIPKASRKFRVLSFCFVDPYDLSVQFSTLAKIAAGFADFLVLLALDMDANRNRAYYLDPNNTKIDKFLGLSDWRDTWKQSEGKDFPRFLAEEYAKQLKSLKYLHVPFNKMKQVRSDVRNLPLYHLALFSRHQLAYKYWEQVLQYSTPQLSINWERNSS